MNTNDMISKIKEVLNLSQEIKLEQLKLDNGTILEAESFEAGQEIFIVTEDEKVAVPVGEYQMEDGRILVVAEEGLIAEIKAEEEEAEEEEVEAKDHEEKEEMGYATKEELAEVKEMIEEIKAMLEPKEEMSEELSADDLGNLMTEELAKHEKLELSEVPVEVQEELNQPAAEPIKANPEVQTKQNFKFATKRKLSTLDRVMNKIINN
jgi:hypothetical protein